MRGSRKYFVLLDICRGMNLMGLFINRSLSPPIDLLYFVSFTQSLQILNVKPTNGVTLTSPNGDQVYTNICLRNEGTRFCNKPCNSNNTCCETNP